MAFHHIQVPIRFFGSFFNHSILVRHRGLIRSKFILMGNVAIALGDGLAPLPWDLKVNLDVKVKRLEKML